MKDMFAFDAAVYKMRQYFREAKGFIEVPTQSRRSILAACEDPKTISQYQFNGVNWPLPQTGQMWLEYELLKNPTVKGVFCVSTSYRNEPNPVEGRHEKIFPMFEFESHGGMKDMMAMETELLSFLGFGEEYHRIKYDLACDMYEVDELDYAEEEALCKDHGDCTFLTHFPHRTHPFWNMKQNDDDKNLYNKIDIIMHGQETIGSAERATNVDEMRENFHTISNGEYADILYKHFTKERVEKELEEYLSHDFFPRFGGGIGVTRMVRAMEMSGLMK